MRKLPKKHIKLIREGELDYMLLSSYIKLNKVFKMKLEREGYIIVNQREYEHNGNRAILLAPIKDTAIRATQLNARFATL